jgi:hypothetical protein
MHPHDGLVIPKYADAEAVTKEQRFPNFQDRNQLDGGAALALLPHTAVFAPTLCPCPFRPHERGNLLSNGQRSDYRVPKIVLIV